MSSSIPESHHDLISYNKMAFAVLSTIMDDGSPQLSPIWFDAEGEYIRFNTARGRVKDKNIQARPEVALTILDPEDPYRYLLIRGQVVDETEDGAIEHFNQLVEKFQGGSSFSLPEGQIRVMYKVEPSSVVAG